jgi:hypothetical protein
MQEAIQFCHVYRQVISNVTNQLEMSDQLEIGKVSGWSDLSRKQAGHQ